MKKIGLITACLGIISTAAMAQQPAKQAPAPRVEQAPAPQPAPARVATPPRAESAPAQPVPAPAPADPPKPVYPVTGNRQQEPAPAPISNSGNLIIPAASPKPAMKKLILKQQPTRVINEEKMKENK